MIVNFSIQNFGSIKNRQTVSFEADESTHLEDAYVMDAGGTGQQLHPLHRVPPRGHQVLLRGGVHEKGDRQVLIELREYLRGYDKTRRYFMKTNKDIYARLKPYLEHAIENARELGNFDEKNPLKALSEMDELFRIEALQAVR